MHNKKAIIIAAPSGAGKTTIVKHLLKTIPKLKFSISATSRKKREGEQDAQDYYFLPAREIREKIQKGEFVEWEEVYSGTYYGTLKSEVERIWADGNVIIFDVDVKGALNLKKYFKDNGLTIFIQVRNPGDLEARLRQRGTEDEASLKKRIEKAKAEMEFRNQFDEVIVNDMLETAQQEAVEIVNNFINRRES